MLVSQESNCNGVFFIKIAGPLNCNFIKKRESNTDFFLWSLRNFFRTICFTEHFQWLLLTFIGLQLATLLKTETSTKMFFFKFTEFLRKSFDRTLPDDCFLCLFVNFEKFFTTPLLWSKCLFHVQVAEFKPPDTAKNYFTGAFQAFYTRTRSCHSKELIYLRSLKIICEEISM